MRLKQAQKGKDIIKIKGKKIGKSLLALTLCLAMVVGSSVSVFAAGEKDCLESHSPPGGYVYYTQCKGNTEWEMGTMLDGVGLLTCKIPGLEAVSVMCTVMGLFDLWNPGGRLKGNYVVYTYYNSRESSFWDHYLFYATAQNGTKYYIGCETDRYWVSNEE